MGTTFHIAEVAQRSGFTPATLRYYEEIGLLAPAGRTPAGYRIYDDASLERLQFIARAKQLGCRLDEIADLTAAWDGGRCATVQERLHAAVADKLTAARSQIAELTALTSDLESAAIALSAHPVDGPCSATCACTTAPDPTPAPLVAKANADADAEPIACTLGAGDLSTRLAEWQTLLEGVTSRQRLDGGIRLEFGPDTPVTEIARPATAEQGCCSFFRFALVVDSRGIALEVHAPPDAQPVLTDLFG
jgi:MerR family transcriptional regulator, copper efflux regulator